ncbi:hypothetical protein ABZX77_30365 [Streptomyces sp. NPDC004237]|uniref:hypothetical protein n=1 Tax=Streptomyces sp. NPDC004237 TaxID=3154455 RepID=UPI0033A7E4D9
MSIIINPGTGPVADATEANAAINITVFGDDLQAAGLPVDSCTRAQGADYGDGRYAFTLAMGDGRTIEIQMPGLPVDQVRFMSEDGQNIWHFPRLYVDDSSMVWEFALGACEPDEDGE